MERALVGLTTNDVRRLAYDLAEYLHLNHPFQNSSRMAGREWLYGFMKCNPQISIRSPQATSISRAIGFNQPKVQLFFNVNMEMVEKIHFKVGRYGIWTKLYKPGKILATRG
jgi:hypothetical protein